MKDSDSTSVLTLTSNQKSAILGIAFLGWFFGGVQIGITGVAMRDAPLDLMDRTGFLDLKQYVNLQGSEPGSLTADDQSLLNQWNSAAAKWFAWYQCAFLFGAAAGGFLLGRLGDRIGRTRALAVSIFVFSALTGLSYFVQSPSQLLLLRFLACIGIGGTWPNGVSLVSEVWSSGARPLVSSAIGMAGNLGIFVMFRAASIRAVTPDDWRWVMIFGACPVLLSAIIWLLIPESPQWLAHRKRVRDEGQEDVDPIREVLGPKYRGTVLVGIALATIPLIGGWGSANWMLPWAGEEGARIGDSILKAQVGQARSITSIVGSLLAGSIACRLGRRRTYVTTSIGALIVAQYAFWFTTPTDSSFLIWVAILGFFNGVYFGWLPFFLPEMFESRIRSTGAGLSFNSGRILTAGSIFLTGATIEFFDGDYAVIGRITSWIFALGLLAIAYAPVTSQRNLDE